MNITLLAKKGGVAKSTVSVLLYEAFRQAGKSVSIHDWDAQGTSSKARELIHSSNPKNPPDKASIVIFDTHLRVWSTQQQRQRCAVPILS